MTVDGTEPNRHLKKKWDHQLINLIQWVKLWNAKPKYLVLGLLLVVEPPVLQQHSTTNTHWARNYAIYKKMSKSQQALLHGGSSSIRPRGKERFTLTLLGVFRLIRIRLQGRHQMTGCTCSLPDTLAGLSQDDITRWAANGVRFDSQCN